LNKLLFSAATALMTIMLVAVSFWSGLTPTARAESSGADWQITVTGLVEHPLNLSLTAITTLPQTPVNAALICVGSSGSVSEEGNWVGVNLWFLLETAGVSPGAVKVAFYASDGYSTDLPLETAKREDVILAYEKDGAPLNEKVRLVVPGKWGYKWISKVTRIELVDYDFKGTWESGGYPDAADIATVTVPEFPSVMAILVQFILVTPFVLLMKKRKKEPPKSKLSQKPRETK
jgi:DMSO/TMAO reductase YedYZ molybdopterin-dependent catalytic subunit